jgi:hypothetical protein
MSRSRKVNGPRPSGSAPAAAETGRTLRQLRVIRVVAIVDFALLVPLVLAALNHAERVVDVLGPIHGAGFLLLLFLCLRGVGQDRWGWWFPALVLVTLGPPGSLIGERRIRRQLQSG